MQLANAIISEEKIQQLLYASVLKSILQQDTLTCWSGHPFIQLRTVTLKLKSLSLQQFSDDIDNFLESIKNRNKIESDCLAIIGIPICMGPLEVNEQLKKILNIENNSYEIEEIKVMRIKYPGYYAILLKFVESSDMQVIYKKLFGNKFNQFQPYRIILRQITKIQIDYEELNFLTFIKQQYPESFDRLQPQLIFQEYLLELQFMKYGREFQCTICQNDIIHSQDESHKNIIVLLCGHFFHTKCLEMLAPEYCPQCGYTLKIESLQFCFYCHDCQNILICMTCLKPFCSRKGINNNKTSHVQKHIEKDNHRSFINLRDKRRINYISYNQSHEKFLEEKQAYIKQMKQQMQIDLYKFQKVYNQNQTNYNNTFITIKKSINNLKEDIQKINIINEDYTQIEQQIQKMEKQSQLQSKVHKLLANRLTELNRHQVNLYELNQQVQQRKLHLQEIETTTKNKLKKIDSIDFYAEDYQSRKYFAKKLGKRLLH